MKMFAVDPWAADQAADVLNDKLFGKQTVKDGGDNSVPKVRKASFLFYPYRQFSVK